MKKIYILSLGCSRNLVDSEILQGLLHETGYSITEDPIGSDIAIINTCGFIKDAKDESLSMIFDLVEMKKQGDIKYIIVTGCLTQRYSEELKKDIPEIDGIFGTSDYTKIPGFINNILAGEKIKEVTENPLYLQESLASRRIMTPNHYAYLKIQEGCSNRCTYCVIPDLRGVLRSRDVTPILQEAQKLKKDGIKELIVVAQDTTSYGMDKNKISPLPELLKEISSIMLDGWVRLLYTHPAHLNMQMVEEIAKHKNICNYIDMPVQHINDCILKKMNRRIDAQGIRGQIRMIRENLNDPVLRTSLIVGFPGETDQEFKELIDFVKEVKFERMGAFAFSQEEGTPAATFKDQISEELKKERLDIIMNVQKKISENFNTSCLDKTFDVLIDEKDEEGDVYMGRTYMDAPEVDGLVYVQGKNLNRGDFVKVKIIDATEYDLVGEPVIARSEPKASDEAI